MKRTLLLLFVLGVFLTSGTTSNLMAQAVQGGTAPAQPAATATQPAANPQTRPQIPVVVVDYMYLMEIHPKLSVEMNGLEQKAKAMQQNFQNDALQLQNMQKELSSSPAGSPDYTKQMEAIRKFDADARLRAIKEEESLQLAEIQCNYQAYQEIKGKVEAYARTNNILVVINHVDIARRLPAEKSLQTMGLELSQMPTIAWRNPNLDITPAIENWLNDDYAKQNIKPVNYDQLKEQRFRSGGGTQLPTNVATGAGQPGRQ